jgi:hypothetical protein
MSVKATSTRASFQSSLTVVERLQMAQTLSLPDRRHWTLPWLFLMVVSVTPPGLAGLMPARHSCGQQSAYLVEHVWTERQALRFGATHRRTSDFTMVNRFKQGC